MPYTAGVHAFFEGLRELVSRWSLYILPYNKCFFHVILRPKGAVINNSDDKPKTREN